MPIRIQKDCSKCAWNVSQIKCRMSGCGLHWTLLLEMSWCLLSLFIHCCWKVWKDYQSSWCYVLRTFFYAIQVAFKSCIRRFLKAFEFYWNSCTSQFSSSISLDSIFYFIPRGLLIQIVFCDAICPTDYTCLMCYSDAKFYEKYLYRKFPILLRFYINKIFFHFLSFVFH